MDVYVTGIIGNCPTFSVGNPCTPYSPHNGWLLVASQSTAATVAMPCAIPNIISVCQSLQVITFGLGRYTLTVLATCAGAAYDCHKRLVAMCTCRFSATFVYCGAKDLQCPHLQRSCRQSERGTGPKACLDRSTFDISRERCNNDGRTRAHKTPPLPADRCPRLLYRMSLWSIGSPAPFLCTTHSKALVA